MILLVKRALSLIIFLAHFFILGCEKLVEKPPPPLKDIIKMPLGALPPVPIPPSSPFPRFENLKQPNQQIAFCRNLIRNNVEIKGDIENWIAVVSSVSTQANETMKIELITPCIRIISTPSWDLGKEEPMYLQLKQFDKGSIVFVSGYYELLQGTNLVGNPIPKMVVRISYLTKAWLE